MKSKYVFPCAEPQCGAKVKFVYTPIDVPLKMAAGDHPVESVYLTCSNGHPHQYYLADGEKS